MNLQRRIASKLPDGLQHGLVALALGLLIIPLTPTVSDGVSMSRPATTPALYDPPIHTGADILTVDSTGQLEVFHANGAGNVGFPQTIGRGWGNVKSLYVVDWNADGRQDILSQWSDGRLKVHFGTDESGFALPLEVGTGWQEKSLTIGSWVSGDPYPGILAKDTAGAVSFYPNPIGRKLGPGRQIGQGFTGFQLTQIDFDGDGNQDIAARDTNGSMFLYRSNGRGDFNNEPGRAIGTGWNVMTHVSAVEGFDGLGSAGFLARNGGGELLYYSVDSGAWGALGKVGNDWHDTTLISGAALPSEPSGELNPADLIAVTGDFDLIRYRTTGAGALANGEHIGTGWVGLRSGFVADWNADGIQDLLAHWLDGRLSMYAGVKGGGFRSPVEMGFGWQDWTLTVGSWDDSDRFPALLGYDNQGRLFRFMNLNGSSISDGIQIGVGWTGLGIVLADLDKDSRADIVARTPTGALKLYRSNGAGAFIDEAPRVIGSGWHVMTGMLSTSGFAGPDTTGIIGRTPENDLLYYPMADNLVWGTPTTIGRGWNGLTLFGSSAS